MGGCRGSDAHRRVNANPAAECVTFCKFKLSNGRGMCYHRKFKLRNGRGMSADRFRSCDAWEENSGNGPRKA